MSTKENHIVFDFDCTLTEKHWWKGIYLGQFSLNSDLVNKLNGREIYILENYKNFDPEICLHRISEFDDMPNLLDYTWGGDERLCNVRNFLKELSESGVKIHISTNGQVNEVMALLDKSNISLDIFTYIHGFNNTRTTKIMYNVNRNKYVKFTTRDKVEFIKYVHNHHPIKEYAYIDDDPCEYAKAREICKTINLKNESGGMTCEYFVFIKELFKMRVVECK